ncbi:hypothetical protein ABNQ38_29405 [Azospirillum sp. A29]|uniref:hypothetical protein n=1 Tax=Azospirillum sp. A29 TaxID=3160606 RepID=UPI003673506D
MTIKPEHTPTEAECNTAPFRASLLATTTIPALGMTFREAADQTRALLEAHPAIPEEDEATQDASGKAWERLHGAILAAPAETFADFLAKAERMACPHIGARTFLLKEAERSALEQDIERLRQQIATNAGTDAEILAAFARWKQAVTELVGRTGGLDDDAFASKSEEVDAAALEVIEPAPATMEGLAAQVYTMFHLEHCGTMENPTDIALNPPFDPDDPHTLAIHTIVNRVKQLGCSGIPTPEAGESLGSLYARWEEARARYLADGDKTDEELEALENGLDQIEDRLESEPVRCAADAVAKLGYFLAASNAMLESGQTPNLNPQLSAPLDRVLAAVEDGAPAMPETMRAPIQALAAGLRQLMQRRVMLAMEAGHAADAYQLPKEVSRAMQAVCVRNAAESAAAEARGSNHVEEVGNEIAGIFRGLDSANRKVFLSLTRFMSVSAHLHDAMLGFAREHGMARHYRAWLEGHLADIPAEQDGANDQRQDADAFADTVAAFEAEAPATLALPLEPTGRMVDAGARAAGITPAQFQAAYAAAVEALKLERAA